MNLTNESKRYNGKCRACGAGYSMIARPAWKNTAPGGYGHTIIVDATGTEYQSDGYRAIVHCNAGCPRAFYASPVAGKYSAKKKCNAKCLESTGHVCECSCGGKNHGAGHDHSEGETDERPSV